MNRVCELIKDKKIYVIGITGGVGCGKSTIVDYLKERFFAYILKADDIGHLVMQKDSLAYESIISFFGEEILSESKEIDRKKLASIVFADEHKLDVLNSIIHPAVEKYIADTIIYVYENTNQKLFVIEAALLIEAGYKTICNDLWYVYADKDTRINRLMSTRGYSKEKCLDIMENQLSEEEFEKNCDFKIDNNNDLKYSKIQIENRMDFCYN